MEEGVRGREASGGKGWGVAGRLDEARPHCSPGIPSNGLSTVIKPLLARTQFRGSPSLPPPAPTHPTLIQPLKRS